MIRKHPLLAFMLLACGYSWTWWGLMLASQHGWLPVQVPAGPWGSFGPLLAACVLCRPAGIAPRLRDFLRRTVGTRPGLGWLLVALLLPALLIALAVGAQGLSVGSLAMPKLDGAVWLPLLFILILVVGGPVGEEFGWRGLVLPKLLQNHTPWLASLIVAALWLIWHLPLFWLQGAAQEGSSITGFAAMVVSSSLLFTWCYLHTGPNLWPVLVLHTSINLCSYVLPSAWPGIDSSRSFSLAMLALFATAALATLLFDRRMRQAPTAPV